jgi:hypothetical protein
MSDNAIKQRREYQRKYREQNKEAINQRHKAWRENNKDKIKEYNKTYWEKIAKKMQEQTSN